MAIKDNFRFSPSVSVVCILLAAVMIYASTWQWERYKAKVELIKTYKSDSQQPPLVLPEVGKEGSVSDPDAVPAYFLELINRKVQARGIWDYEHQVIITNKKGRDTSAGHHLVTPLLLPDGIAILVSRGFIPFGSRAKESWDEFNEGKEGDVVGVLKQSITPFLIGPKNPKVGEGEPFKTIFLFEEISKLATQLPYKVIPGVFIQRLGGPASSGPSSEAKRYPEESISIEVPPSTHFGYTIEWAILAFLTLGGGIIYQLWPRDHRDKEEREEAKETD